MQNILNLFPTISQVCHPAKCVDQVKKECKAVEREMCRMENVIDLVDKLKEETYLGSQRSVQL